MNKVSKGLYQQLQTGNRVSYNPGRLNINLIKSVFEQYIEPKKTYIINFKGIKYVKKEV